MCTLLCRVCVKLPWAQSASLYLFFTARINKGALLFCARVHPNCLIMCGKKKTQKQKHATRDHTMRGYGVSVPSWWRSETRDQAGKLWKRVWRRERERGGGKSGYSFSPRPFRRSDPSVWQRTLLSDGSYSHQHEKRPAGQAPGERMHGRLWQTTTQPADEI